MTIAKMCLLSSCALAIALSGSCTKKKPVNSSNISALEGQSILTTYYPTAGDVAMGPGHFSCPELNNIDQWYVAPSDTFGDERLWQGAPCPAADQGQNYANCQAVQKTCGVKLQLKCADKCRANAPSVIVMITDFCPKNHPFNMATGNCQGGAHFDIGKPVWDLMQGKEDNISVTYKVVADSTALGPIASDSASGN